MEDLIEELLNVLAKPARHETDHSAASTAKQLATSYEGNIFQHQRNGFLDSPNSQQHADRAMENNMSAKDRFDLMNVASFANNRLPRQASSLATLVDTSVRSLLFDAGIAVLDLNGHQTFLLQNQQTHTQSQSTAVGEIVVETAASPSNSQANAFEMDAADIDESVMSAFDIGEFEADTHARQAGGEETASNNGQVDSSDRPASEFEPDDLDVDIADLYEFNHESEETTAPDNDSYEAADNIDFSDELSLDEVARPLVGSVADVSLDEIENGRRPNPIARWFQRWLNPVEDNPKTQSSEAQLFKTDYAPEADPDVYSDLDEIDEVAFEPELIPEPPTDEFDEDVESIEVSKTAEVSETTEAADTIEFFDPAETFDIEETLPVEPELGETVEALQPAVAEGSESLEETELVEDDKTFSEILEAVEAENNQAAETALNLDEANAVTTNETPEQNASNTDDIAVSVKAVPLESARAEDLAIFEPDFDPEADSDEEALLEALGEKTWLSPTENANEALHESAAAGDISGVWAALEANANVNSLSRTQQTALSVAVEAGHLPVVRMLLEMCADPNLADLRNGAPASYPLMVAASKTAKEVRDDLLQLLLASGAEVNQTNVMGQTALMSAAERGHLDALRLLSGANANLDVQDLLGQSAIAYAKKSEQAAAIEFLQQTALEREQAIAFLRAVTQGNLEAVQQWLAAGMSANTRVARMSALTQAAAQGEVEIAQRLIEAGADINYQFHPSDPTPLLHAAYRGQAEMVALLLEAGASTHPTPDASIGALDYAEIGQKKASDPTTFEPAIALLATLAKRE